MEIITMVYMQYFAKRRLQIHIKFAIFSAAVLM